MDTSREDVGIAIRSAFLKRGTQQRFSLFVLVLLSGLFIFLETIESKPLNLLRSIVKDIVYRSAVVASAPFEGMANIGGFFSGFILISAGLLICSYANSITRKDKVAENSIFKRFSGFGIRLKI